MVPDCLRTLSATLCRSNFSLEGGNLGNMFMTTRAPYISKWGISNVPFCAIFVPFHFYLIMTLVVLCLHNMFMVLLIFELGNIKIGGMKPIFLDSGSPRGEEGFIHVWAWFVIIASVSFIH